MRTFDTSSSRAPAGAGRTGAGRHTPPPAGLGASGGAYLWAAGYPPADSTDMDVDGHPRWPQIVLACPDGVNPAARPIPPQWRSRRNLGVNEVVREAGSGFRVDPAQSRQAPATTTGIGGLRFNQEISDGTINLHS